MWLVYVDTAMCNHNAHSFFNVIRQHDPSVSLTRWGDYLGENGYISNGNKNVMSYHMS